MVSLGMAKYAFLGVALLLGALFIKRSAEVGIGPAANEVAGSVNTFGGGLGAIGSGLGSLGTGFSQFLRGTLDPFGLTGFLGQYLAPKQSNPTAAAGNQNTVQSISTPAGTVGGFSVAQSTTEARPSYVAYAGASPAGTGSNPWVAV